MHISCLSKKIKKYNIFPDFGIMAIHEKKQNILLSISLFFIITTRCYGSVRSIIFQATKETIAEACINNPRIESCMKTSVAHPELRNIARSPR
jgi:hypothetical protein